MWSWPAADLPGGADRGPSMSEGWPGDGVIRTPDQRLWVFVSSTLGELAAERQAVARAIAALRLTPVMSELGARPHPPREVYRAYLAQSDVFIGLYWQRYGQLAPGLQISGLEDEFELARGMPRLLYVKAPAPGREPRLAALVDRVARQVSYRKVCHAGGAGPAGPRPSGGAPHPPRPPPPPPPGPPPPP